MCFQGKKRKHRKEEFSFSDVPESVRLQWGDISKMDAATRSIVEDCARMISDVVRRHTEQNSISVLHEVGTAIYNHVPPSCLHYSCFQTSNNLHIFSCDTIDEELAPL